MEQTSSALAARLRAGTRAMHVAAERSGVMRQLLVDRALTRAAYVALLRSLHAIYAALEGELVRHAAHPAVAPVWFPEIARADRLASDLETLHGPDWRGSVAPAAAAGHYAERLRSLGDDAPELLAAHAYVRYMGDLSGGQLLAPLVATAVGLAPNAGLSFYDFAALGDVGAFKHRFRTALDSLPAAGAAADRLVDEANHAFALHVRLFDELAQSHAG